MAEAKTKYVIRSHKVDKFTTLRSLIPVGPATCDTCGYDVLQVNSQKFAEQTWEDLDDETKVLVKGILKKHKEKHSKAETEAMRLMVEEKLSKEK